MQKTVSVIAWLVAWGWALIAGVGGFWLLVHEGPLPITNGWFAMFSGIAACPLTARLLNRYGHVVVPAYIQFSVALLIWIAGRIAVVVVLHRPFLRHPFIVIGLAFVVIGIAAMARRTLDHVSRPTSPPI